MSGAGKSTLAERAVEQLTAAGLGATIIDGDDVRRTHTRHLGFSREHVGENNALIADLCQQRRSLYDVIFVPVIAPYDEHRKRSRRTLEPGIFFVHVHAALDTLEERDTKGLYKKAREGEIDNLIGVSSTAPYQEPLDADLRIDTGRDTLDDCTAALLDFVLRHPPKVPGLSHMSGTKEFE